MAVMPQRCAVVDLGSNTAKLLVADVTPEGITKVCLELSLPCRLGLGLDASGLIADKSLERLLDVVGELVSTAKAEGAGRIAAVATSAVRSAKNGEDVVAALIERHRVTIEVLGGDEEAEGILRGVMSDPFFRHRRLLVMDLGGGSAEWIESDPGAPPRKLSVEVGCVRMSERFPTDHPLKAEQRSSLELFLMGELRHRLPGFSAAGRTMVLTGGTACALAALREPGFLERKNAGGRAHLSIGEASALVDELAKRSLAEIEAHPEMPPQRADVIVAGGITILTALGILGASEFYVSRRSLRYGRLMDMAKEA